MKRFIASVFATCAIFGLAGCQVEPDYSTQVSTLGIIVSSTQEIITWKIPMAETFEADKRILFKMMVDKYTAGMARVGKDFANKGFDVNFLPKGEEANFDKRYAEVLEKVLGAAKTRTKDETGEFSDARQLSNWKKYVIPQAYLAFAGTRFAANAGLGAGFSATVFIVTVPWVKVGIERRTGKQLYRTLEVDSAILGAPNVDIGVGVGGGVPIHAGVGVVWGALDTPNDLAGLSVNIAGSGAVPFIGGGMAKFGTVLRNPPLTYALAGYQSGTAGGWEVHGGIEGLMILSNFMKAMKLTSSDN